MKDLEENVFTFQKESMLYVLHNASIDARVAAVELKKEIIGLESWDVKDIKTMHQLFQKCKNLKKIDLSTWNVSQCERFDGMFDGCENLTDIGDISDWKISPNADMTGMFNYCPKELIEKLPKHILKRL